MRMKELLVAGPTSNPSLQGQVDCADVCQPLFVRQAGLAMSIDWTEIHFNICIWSSFSWNWSSSVCRCWLTSRRSFIRIAGRESAPYLPLLQIHPRHRQRRQVTLMTMMMGDDDCDFKPAPGPGQSPGLSPHPVFHPPSSPGENFHQNKIRLSPTRPTIRNASNQIIIIIITMIRNATNPDPTWTSSLLSLAGLTRIPTPSPGEKKHDFNKKIWKQKCEIYCSTWRSERYNNKWW